MNAIADTPPEKQRRSRRKNDRPAELLDAALELFTQKGYSATRAEEIARKAGVSKGTLFLYFATKEELFEAVVKTTVMSVLRDAQNFALNFTGSPAELLRQLIQLWWKRHGSTKTRTIPRLILTEAHHFPDCALFYEREVLAPCREMVLSIVQRGIASGDFRPLNLDHVWLSFHALLVYPSICSNCASDDKAHDMDTFVQHHTDLLIRGLSS